MKKAFNLAGKASIRLVGLNVEKFLNLLISAKYKLFDIKREEYNIFTITVETKHLKAIIAQIEKYGYKYDILKTYGVYRLFDFCIKRFWLVLAVLACVGVYIFSNNFLWKISISGNHNISTQDITTVLSNNHISIGKAKRNISSRDIESLLLDSIDGLAMVSAYIHGNSLNINVSEKVPQTHLIYKCIVSEYNGIIKDFELISGTAAKKKGDIIMAGDILVYPYIIDSSGNKKSIKAQANIVLEVDFNETIEYNESREIYEDTGRQFVSLNTSLFGLKFNKDNNCPYKNYRKLTTTSFVFNNMIVPIKKIKTTFYEQTKKQTVVPFEKVSQELISQAYQNGEQKLKGHRIIDKTHTVLKVGKIYYITANFRAIVKMGE